MNGMLPSIFAQINHTKGQSTKDKELLTRYIFSQARINMQIIQSFIAALTIVSAAGFTHQARLTNTRLMASTDNILGDAQLDIVQHAKYCADSGECSLEDMEKLCDALHQERISHMAAHQTGINNPHGLTADLEHTMIENNLKVQMGLIRDRLATEHMQEDSMYGVNPHSATMKLPILDATLDEESSETLVICLAIAALALLPQMF